MAERMTRYQLAFAPFLNKYINDELSKHLWRQKSNWCASWSSKPVWGVVRPGWVRFPHVSAKRKEKEYGYESDAGVRTSAHWLFW